MSAAYLAMAAAAAAVVLGAWLRWCVRPSVIGYRLGLLGGRQLARREFRGRMASLEAQVAEIQALVAEMDDAETPG